MIELCFPGIKKYNQKDSHSCDTGLFFFWRGGSMYTIRESYHGKQLSSFDVFMFSIFNESITSEWFVIRADFDIIHPPR